MPATLTKTAVPSTAQMLSGVSHPTSTRELVEQCQKVADDRMLYNKL